MVHAIRVLGLVPARGGSEGILRKNLHSLAGISLIARACMSARRSKSLERVVVSTDDDEIAREAERSGAEVPFRRPASLGGPAVPMIDVILHALDALRLDSGYRPDAVALLQPTSPMRRPFHIDAAVSLLAESGADSVVSVVEVPHQFSPGSAMRLVGGRLVPYEPGLTATRRQDKPVVYARNGPAVLITQVATVEGGDLYGRDCRPLVMTPEASIDIDTPFDMEFAEWLLARREDSVL